MRSRKFTFLGERSMLFGALGLCLLLLMTMGQAQAVSANALATGKSGASAQLLPVVALSDSAIAVDAGWYHTCAVTRAGGVKCWGSNRYGGLGNNSLVSSNMPVDVVGLTGASAVASGSYHTCALTTSGVKCWGANYYGQLGNNSTAQSQTPVNVSNLATGVTAIGAGGDFSCALKNGGVQCWGHNNFGQLGNNSTTGSHVPFDVQGLAGGVTAISVGASHACALVGGGVKCWGWNANGQLGNNSTIESHVPVDVIGLSGVTAIAAGEVHTCALITGGGVKCWGWNIGWVPNEVSGISGVTSLSGGRYFTCALAGMAKCWGENREGQLGDGTTSSNGTVVNVAGLTSAVAISAGRDHACALTATSTVKCWGSNDDGRLGIGEWPYHTAPVDATGLTTTRMMGASSFHTCVVLEPTGTVKCWGNNANGELGNNSTVYSNVPVDVTGLSGVTAVAPGRFHTCARMSGGTVKCWGFNNYGQLGDSSNVRHLTPVDVPGLAGVSAIASGESHTCAIINPGGTVQCWGDNTQGQLGDGTNTSRNHPVSVLFLADAAIAITAGDHHTCVIVGPGGAVQCWGDNSSGQLGNDSTTDSNTPVSVGGLSGVVGIVAGGLHTCAGTATGAQCWGNNLSGQLGNGNFANYKVPVPVSGLGPNAAIGVAGDAHTCVGLSNGTDIVTVKCWGDNTFGQLGNGSTTKSNVPVDVIGMPSTINASIPRIMAGEYHTCAEVYDASLGYSRVKCWGSDLYGQLGHGMFGLKSSATNVLGFVDTFFSFLPALRK